MRNLQFVVYIIFIFLAIRCKQEDQPALTKYKISKNLDFKYDSLVIRVDSSKLSIYQNFDFFESNDSVYYAGYNISKSTLDIFNLTSKSFLKAIKIEQEGPNGMNEPIEVFKIINFDSILLMSHNRIAIINKNDSIIYRLNINQASTDFKHFKGNNFYTFGQNNLFFSKQKREILISNISYEYSLCSPEHYEAPLMGVINVDSKKSSLLGPSYPSIFKKKSYGFLSSINLTKVNEDSIIYNFPCSPDIYIYSRGKDMLSIVGGNSLNVRNEPLPLEWSQCQSVDAKMKNFLEGSQFKRIHFDSSTNFYYRLHLSDISYVATSGGGFPTFSNKKQYLMVFDKQFSVIKEIPLDFRTFLDGAFVTTKGLFVPATREESIMRFLIYKF